jgi:ABC-type transport system involved in cytochrome c biogenesis ATPase subunit
MILSKFEIKGLYKKYNVSLTCNDNKLILVAKNGAGKTTLLRIIFYFLTKQWDRLCNYEFDSILAVIDGSEFVFTRNNYISSGSPSDRLTVLAEAYPIYKKFILEELASWDIKKIADFKNSIDVLAEKHDVPAGLLARMLDILVANRGQVDQFKWTTYVLYLPTYRRIEDDFEKLFSEFGSRLESYFVDVINNLPGDLDNGDMQTLFTETYLSNEIVDVWHNGDREKWLKKKENFFIELSEFGMEDLSFKTREIASSFSSKSEFDDRIGSFLNTCNNYFEPEKTIVFDSHLSKLKIKLNGQETDYLELDNLSSGEKQIVSIFFHLYLEEIKPFIIIDEPEISLSLRWQETILSDILSANIEGLLVATHSPYVISRDLMSFAHGLNEFIY